MLAEHRNAARKPASKKNKSILPSTSNNLANGSLLSSDNKKPLRKIAPATASNELLFIKKCSGKYFFGGVGEKYACN